MMELPNREHICFLCGTIELFYPLVHYWDHIEGFYYCPKCDEKFMGRYGIKKPKVTKEVAKIGQI